MMLGAVTISTLAFIEVGGYTGLLEKYGKAIPTGKAASNYTECNVPSPDSFTMLRSADDGEMPWIGFLFGQTPASIWYWAADQMMVQRALASKSLSHAKGGCIFASFLKLSVPFLIVMPGMISRVLEPSACHSKAVFVFSFSFVKLEIL